MSAAIEEKAEEKEQMGKREIFIIYKIEKWIILIISNLEGKKTNKILSIFINGTCTSASRRAIVHYGIGNNSII